MAEKSNDVVLKVAGISKRFGGLQALSDVGITIERGQVYGLIGPNGAGKTTFFNVITGLYTPDSGTFELAGKPYEPTAVHEVAKAGIARTFQNIRLFPEMTALENVMVGRHIRTGSGLIGAVFRTPLAGDGVGRGSGTTTAASGVAVSRAMTSCRHPVRIATSRVFLPDASSARHSATCPPVTSPSEMQSRKRSSMRAAARSAITSSPAAFNRATTAIASVLMSSLMARSWTQPASCSIPSSRRRG